MQKLWPLINARFCESSLLTTTITELLRSQLYTQTNEFLDCCSTFTEKRNLAGVNRAPARQKYVMNKISTVIQMRCSFSVLQKSTCLRWNGQINCRDDLKWLSSEYNKSSRSIFHQTFYLLWYLFFCKLNHPSVKALLFQCSVWLIFYTRKQTAMQVKDDPVVNSLNINSWLTSRARLRGNIIMERQIWYW